MMAFTFGVLTFNHERYILEHLESIKYLIQEYGGTIAVDIIINDDHSQDKTIQLIQNWLQLNSSIFRTVTKLFNPKNMGTCQGFLNIIKHTQTESLKITAGDDVYSCENLFKHAALSDNISILSGVPLNIIGGQLSKNKKEILEIFLSQRIYRSKNYISRFIWLSNNNAPNIIYKKSTLTTKKYEDFISTYDVIEDWPTQIFIAENYPHTRFELIKKVFVYYRRTPGSTFIVANKRFKKDKIAIYDYLIARNSKALERMALINRKICFLMGNATLNKLFNFSFYLFAAQSVSRIYSENREANSIDINKFHQHYNLIKRNAANFYYIAKLGPPEKDK